MLADKNQILKRTWKIFKIFERMKNIDSENWKLIRIFLRFTVYYVLDPDRFIFAVV